ncbi:MAG: hypothetical protein QM758_08170 [Armatimonas sp.]
MAAEFCSHNNQEVERINTLEVFTSERSFQIASCRMSHQQLLIRSGAFHGKTNLDIVFYGVLYMDIKWSMQGIAIHTDNDEYDNYFHNRIENLKDDVLKKSKNNEDKDTYWNKIGYKSFFINSNDDIYIIIALKMSFGENTLNASEDVLVGIPS